MFDSLNDIKEQLNLKSTSKKDLRKELKIKLKECHPDSSGGGEFESIEKKSLFDKIMTAIEFIDTPAELVLKREISDLKRVVQNLAFKRNEDEVLIKREEILTTKIETSIKNYSSTHLFPKITSSIITGFLSLIWLFPKSITEHIILRRYIDVESPLFSAVWFVGILLTGQLWFMLNTLERKDKDRKNSLKLEAVQNMLFDKFIKFRYEKYREEVVIQFTKEDFINFIRNFNLRFEEYQPERRNSSSHFRIFFTDSRIDMGLAQELSEIVLNRMKAKELVRVITQKTISDIFIFELNDQLKENYYRQRTYQKY